MNRRILDIALVALAMSHSAIGGVTYEEFRSLHSSYDTNDVRLIGYTIWSISRAPTTSVSLVKNMDPEASQKTLKNLRGLAETRATNAFESLSFVDNPPQSQKHIFFHVVEGPGTHPS